jgi:hypothetical protein
MDLQKACDVLGITKENFTMRSVKKAYYQKALETHPDKCKGHTSSPTFTEVLEAYTLLSNCNDVFTEKSNEPKDSTYSSFLSSFISSTIGIEVKSDQIAQTLLSIKAGYEDTTIRMFSEMNRHDAVKLYSYLEQYATMFGFNREIMTKLKSIVETKVGKDTFITLKPTLANILRNDVFKLEREDDTYCIPLWHDELEYDIDDQSLIVSVSPIIPENMTIDEDNNLHVVQHLKISDIFGQDTYEIDLMCKSISINVREIMLKPKQTVCFPNQGIARINTKNMFSVGKLAHIFVHITLTV